MKTCSKCKTDKDGGEFNRRKSSADGLRSQCRVCEREYQKEYEKTSNAVAVKKNREPTPEYKALQRESSKKYRGTPKGKAAIERRRESPAYKAAQKRYQDLVPRKTARKRRASTPEHKIARKEYRMVADYGITPAQHRFLYMHQNGCCKICGKAIPYDRVQTDHDHVTGRLRGLLCCKCNIGMHYVDNIELHRKLVEYKDKYGANDGMV